MCAGYSSSCPTTYPSNRREGFIGVSGSSMWTTVAHEMGHMLSWPHSKTGISGSSYDNAIDLMSGNYNAWNAGSGTRWGTYYEPYATVAINRCIAPPVKVTRNVIKPRSAPSSAASGPAAANTRIQSN